MVRIGVLRSNADVFDLTLRGSLHAFVTLLKIHVRDELRYEVSGTWHCLWMALPPKSAPNGLSCACFRHRPEPRQLDAICTLLEAQSII